MQSDVHKIARENMHKDLLPLHAQFFRPVLYEDAWLSAAAAAISIVCYANALQVCAGVYLHVSAYTHTHNFVSRVNLLYLFMHSRRAETT
jgi:hypothetical protein